MTTSRTSVKTSFAAIASAIVFVCAPLVAHGAAPSADPAVVAATKQMLAAMKLHDSLAATMQQMEQRIPAQMKASAVTAIEANPNLSEQQKADALKKADENIARSSTQLHAVFSDPTLIDDMIDEMVPLYAETYTLDEIRQLTAFYTSPVGQKMITTMPALMGRSMEMSNRVMMPRLQKAMAHSAQAAAVPAAGGQ